jgi:hypothetical protein
MKLDEAVSKIQAHKGQSLGEMESSSSKNLAFKVDTGKKVTKR